MHKNYLDSVIKQFCYHRDLGWKTLLQVPDEALSWSYNDESNSLASLVKHLSANMRSRFTDFLSTDGEKPWRKRDEEFAPEVLDRAAVIGLWNQGWDCLLNTLDHLQPDDLDKIVYIRNQGHTVVEAINRQLSHYAYHVGQMVFLGKMLRGEHWHSLSIPVGQSKAYNEALFSQSKDRAHFTDGLIDPKSQR